MNKKLIIIPALLVAIGGGALLAQTDYFEAALSNPTVTAADAKELALKEVNGDIINFEYDGDDLNPHYEIDIVKDDEKVELKIDANSGAVKITERETLSQIVKQETSTVMPTTPAPETTSPPTSESKSTPASTPSSTKAPAKATFISEQQAKDIALAKAPGTVTEIELDDDDDRRVYEIEIHNGKMEYEFKIDARTGSIIEYTEDLDD